MANPKTPGVIIDEVSTFPSSVAAVPTAIPGFVGYTEKAELLNGDSVLGEPIRINSLLEFETIFGGPFIEEYNVVLENSGIEVSPSSNTSDYSQYILYYQISMYFRNGGGSCYVVSMAEYDSSDPVIDAGDLTPGIDKLEEIDEVSLVLVPESVFVTDSDRLDIYTKMLSHCKKMEDRLAILDTIHVDGNDIIQDADNFRSNNINADNLKYGATYYPDLKTNISYLYNNQSVAITDNRTPSVYSSGDTLQTVLDGDSGNNIPPNIQLYNDIVDLIEKNKLSLYPSSSMAGVYARTDSQRGVWKAPANTSIFGAITPNIKIDDQDQESLNITSSGKSINAIRSFKDRGTLVWGARTLDGNSNEWRYINVRRLFLFVEESIAKATSFAVFEPNTANTWTKVKKMSEAFLTSIWREGGLAGSTTQDAFYVKVGLGETMTAQDILEGRMIVEIGMAAARPAEFIILKFSHKLQES